MAESSNTANIPQGPTRVEVTKFSDHEMFHDFQNELNAAVGGLSKILTKIDENTQGLPQAAAFYTEQGGYSATPSRHTAEDASAYGGVGARVGASVGGIVLPPGVEAPPIPAPAGTSGGPSNPAAQAPGAIVQHVQNAISSALTPLGQSQSLWTPMFNRPAPGSSDYQENDQGQQTNPSTGVPYDNPAIAAAKYGSQYVLPAAAWSSVAPAIQSAKQFMDPGALSQWGTQLGVPPSQGATNIGPFRIPFGSLGAGISDVASSAWTGLTTPGLSTGQVMQGKQQLSELGWTPDSPMYGQLSAGVNELTQTGGSRLGLNPNTTELLDQSTRYGTASLEGMVSTLKKIPGAANDAQVSWEQMASDMKSMGDLYNSQGGTVAAGAKFAQQWATQTGLPPSVALAAAQNPFVQSVGTMQTGLMPQLQGLMSPSERIDSTFSAVNQMYGAMSGMQPSSSPIPGPGGFTNQVSSRDQAAALAGQFTGLKPEVIKAMTNPKLSQGIQSGAAVGDAFKSWNARTQDHPGAWSMDPTGKGRDLGDLVKQMQSARSVTGKKMFSDGEINQIRGLSVDSPQVRQAARDNLQKAGLTSQALPRPSDMQKQGGFFGGVAGVVQKGSEAAAAATGTRFGPTDPLQNAGGQEALNKALRQQREDVIQKLAHESTSQGQKAQQILSGRSMSATGGSSPKVTLELSKSAKQMLQFQGKPGATKLEAGAGAGSTNSGYAGSTQIPSWVEPTNTNGP